MINKISTNNYKPGLDIDFVKKKYNLNIEKCSQVIIKALNMQMNTNSS